MLHTEVRFLQSNNLSFNPKMEFLWVSSNIVQYNTIFTKKVQNCFEVMINYIIALTSHARRNNVSLFICVLANFLFHRWYFLHHEFVLDWLWVHSWTQTLCIKQGMSDLHLAQLSSCHDVSPQSSSVKAGRQQMWVRRQVFVRVVHVLNLTELSTSGIQK